MDKLNNTFQSQCWWRAQRVSKMFLCVLGTQFVLKCENWLLNNNCILMRALYAFLIAHTFIRAMHSEYYTHASHFGCFFSLAVVLCCLSFPFLSWNDSMFWPIAYWYKTIYIHVVCSRPTTYWCVVCLNMFVRRWLWRAGTRVCSRTPNRIVSFRFDFYKNALTK